MKISDVISDRLDALCALVNRDGDLPGTIYRQDIVSALIALAREDVGDLQRLILDYHDLKVRDALVGSAKASNVIELKAPRPGRRTLPAS